MKKLVTKLRLDQRSFPVGERRVGPLLLLFWSFLFIMAVRDILKGSGDYFTFSWMFSSATFTLFIVADFFHEFASNVALVFRSVGVLFLLAAGVTFLLGAVLLPSGPPLAAVFVVFALLFGFGLPYLQGHRDKRQNQS